MARPHRRNFPGAFSHVFSRGNDRRDIFLDDDDRYRFLLLLAEVVTISRWRLHAWVVMANHYHLLIETPEANLSAGMKSLNERYAEWFNWRHNRVGHLLQGRFGSVAVEEESHLRELLRYIVLNPVRAGVVQSPDQWKWSNYQATTGLIEAPPWLEVRWTIEQFGGVEGYQRFVAEAPLQGNAVPQPLDPRLRTLEALAGRVAYGFGEQPDELQRKSRSYGRKALAQLAFCQYGIPLRLIARWMGVSKTAVVKLVRNGEMLEKTDEFYARTLMGIGTELS
jgi:REP element-mobilizing transposase RayT